MALRSVVEVPEGANVLVRMDLDIPMRDGRIEDTDRLKKSLPTITTLLKKHCHLLIIGHLGRPDGHDPAFSLYPVYQELMTLIASTHPGSIRHQFIRDMQSYETFDITMLENLRYWKEEETNDPSFLTPLIQVSTGYVNDALGSSHRPHRSVLLWKELPTYYGISFISEVEKIMKVVSHPSCPMTLLLGGVKEDKLSYLPRLLSVFDHICIGGKLPLLMTHDYGSPVVLAKLRKDGLDLNAKDIQVFRTYIAQSKTIIWVGAMGCFEREDAKGGTREIATAVAKSSAYTIIAGGDTEASVSGLGIEHRINLIASGGGMLLEFLSTGTLPAWENIR